MRFTVAQAELSNAVDKALAAPAAKPLMALIARSAHPSYEMVIRGLPEGRKTVRIVKKSPPPGKIVVYGMPGGPKVM
ncbi:MAG: hypothetical protein WA655_21675 [Candidatus Korobacteraceae bacterium]